MPILFIHGVNNRDSDCSLPFQRRPASLLFNQLVVPAAEGFPGFAVLPEVYWGDLGAKFAWDLRSVPPTELLKSLGPDAADLGRRARIGRTAEPERTGSQCRCAFAGSGRATRGACSRKRILTPKSNVRSVPQK